MNTARKLMYAGLALIIVAVGYGSGLGTALGTAGGCLLFAALVEVLAS